MNRHPRRHVAAAATVWLAWLAVLAGALLPGWAHALGHRDVHRMPGWTEVCSAQGSRWVRIADPAADTPAHGVGAWLEHCPDCVAGLDGAAMPPGPPGGPMALPPDRSAAAGALPAPVGAERGRRPPARGPPPAG